MIESLKTKLDRMYSYFIGYNKSIDPTRQVIDNKKQPERVHVDSTYPEYFFLQKLSVDVAFQFPPNTSESIQINDIGTLEEWGEILLGRIINPGETIEEYRLAILDAFSPTARGGNNEDIDFWKSEIANVRKLYPYVGSRDVAEIDVDDIEGRLDGAYVYVRSDIGNGIPDSTIINNVRNMLLANGSISFGKCRVLPIVLRDYNFVYEIKPSPIGSSSSVSEAQNRVIEITQEILDRIEPYIKYVDLVRNDTVSAGEFYTQIKRELAKPPYRYELVKLRIDYLGSQIRSERLPKGEIGYLRSWSFV